MTKRALTLAVVVTSTLCAALGATLSSLTAELAALEAQRGSAPALVRAAVATAPAEPTVPDPAVPVPPDEAIPPPPATLTPEDRAATDDPTAASEPPTAAEVRQRAIEARAARDRGRKALLDERVAKLALAGRLTEEQQQLVTTMLDAEQAQVNQLFDDASDTMDTRGLRGQVRDLRAATDVNVGVVLGSAPDKLAAFAELRAVDAALFDQNSAGKPDGK